MKGSESFISRLRARRSNNALDRNIKRAWAVLIVMGLGFAGIAASLWGKAITHGDEYRAKAEENQLHDSEIRPARGKIFDSNMEVLAESAAVRAVVCWPAQLEKIPKDEDRRRIDTVRSLADPVVGCPHHARRLSEIMAEREAEAAARDRPHTA